MNKNLKDLGKYSIKDLEHLSGIKAHTIRIWEQRYDFLSPQRSETNIRSYNDDDLKKILNIAFLKDKGLKISKILELPSEQISELLIRYSASESNYNDQLHNLTLCMLDMDERRFEKLLSTNLLQLGLEKTVLNIIYPFLNKIGILWQSGAINPCHEHFISNLIRQKLIVAIDGLNDPVKDEKFLLFLPEGELHEIGLLFSAYLLKSKGYKVIYFGQSVPLDDLAVARETHNPAYVFTICTASMDQDALYIYLMNLSALFKDVKVFISGGLVDRLNTDLPDNILILHSPKELLDLIEKKQI